MAFEIVLDHDYIFVTLTIEDDKELFQEFHSQKDEIEDELGIEPIWEGPEATNGGNVRNHIRAQRNADFTDRIQRHEFIDWPVQTGEQYHDRIPERFHQVM